MADPGDRESVLRKQLTRYPAPRYPIQNATIRFHLGSYLLTGGDAPAACLELGAAADLFAPLPVEQAKALLMWGVALRAAGEMEDAAIAFQRAATGFEQVGMAMERTAAIFNLGLAEAQAGESMKASDTLARAAAAFGGLGATREAAVAQGEQGAALVAAGRYEEAIAILEPALAAVRTGGDEAARGQVVNALGLARLGTGDFRQAVEAFDEALSAHPLTIRPEGYAMAKANLAIAYEASGQPSRARLAAGQAEWVTGVPPAVLAQTAALLERLGREVDDLLRVLPLEPVDRWAGIVRDEMMRWLALDNDALGAAVTAFVDVLIARPGDNASVFPLSPERLAEAWLTVLIELPPSSAEAIIEAVLEAPGAGEDRFRVVIQRTILGFPSPQLLRMEATFAAVRQRRGSM